MLGITSLLHKAHGPAPHRHRALRAQSQRAQCQALLLFPTAPSFTLCFAEGNRRSNRIEKRSNQAGEEEH